MLHDQLTGRAKLTTATERHFRLLRNVLQTEAHSVEQKNSVVEKAAL